MDIVLAQVIVVCYWSICFFLGSLLLLGLIDYERNGGDPMKRNIIDMVHFKISLFNIF